MTTLGKLERIDDLRQVWPNEPKNFTKWLAQEENLELLSEAIGIGLVLEEAESPVGDFSVDLYATDEDTGKRIIIENQLEYTNHDHLGKILTYAAGKDASVVVWIVKRARDEHRKAIEWLNSHTDENIGFFLVEVELWKIDSSLPAPKFNIVERPNEWAKEMKATANLSEIKLLQLHLWKCFKDYASGNSDFINIFSLRKAHPHQWYDLSVGSSKFHISLTVNTQKHTMEAALYIIDDKEIYFKFERQKEKVREIMQEKVSWKEAKKACRFFVSESADITGDETDWPQYFSWLCEMSLRLRKVVNEVNL